jgi:hypothetical protein
MRRTAPARLPAPARPRPCAPRAAALQHRAWPTRGPAPLPPPVACQRRPRPSAFGADIVRRFAPQGASGRDGGSQTSASDRGDLSCCTGRRRRPPPRPPWRRGDLSCCTGRRIRLSRSAGCTGASGGAGWRAQSAEGIPVDRWTS